MVDSFANLALETLRDLLVEETKLLRSVHGEVEQVNNDLRRIHAMLMKADGVKSHSPTLKENVKQLKDLAFQAETVLETYAVKVTSKKEGRSFEQRLKRYICILCECSYVHEVGRDMRDIKSRLADLTEKFKSEFGQQSTSSSGRQQEDLMRLTLAHEVEPHFVGMEKEIEELVSMVKDERRREARVVKIYGMGGLGKTTLARKIYNHGEVASYARAWVCITQQFQAKAVLGNILKQLENDKERNKDIDSMDDAGLMVGVYRLLEQRKKCLLVIDDIWENEHWEIIKKAFPMNCNVLLTTRNENIANQESHPYKLELLTQDQGWDLLKKISLAPGIKSFEVTGRDIVEKCGRLPLSISVIGGILHQKEHTEWKQVNRNMDSYLRHGEGVEEYKRVKQVLELSYDALPYYLKPCFLYLACFPEDEEIETETLYLLWMAEGFISHQDKGRNESLMDVAERYLSELSMRCMVQVNKSLICSTFKKFDSCRLHDLMHDLCSLKAEDDNFLKRLQVSTPSPVVNSINRLAIINNGDTRKAGVKGLEKVKDLRSFLLLTGNEFGTITFEDVKINLEGSLCLRIFVVEHCKFEDEKLPDKVGKLIHLRYLSLRNSEVRELPNFVCGMPYLQTLDLRRIYMEQPFRLPNEIWRMKRLKHLFLPYNIEVIGGEKLRLYGLDELETLQVMNSKTARIADIPKLMSLRKLSVTIGDTDSMSAVLESMSNNNKSRPCEWQLVIESCDLSRDVLKSVLMFPSLSILNLLDCNVSGGLPYYEQGMCQNLVVFQLGQCKVRGEDMNVNVMEVLGNYPILQALYLTGVEFANTETFICPPNSFPQLKNLILQGLPNIKKWEVEEGAMPKLAELLINRCINLEKVPDGLRFISTLRQLLIWGMPKEFTERVRGRDNATVSHIPNIILDE